LRVHEVVLDEDERDAVDFHENGGEEGLAERGPPPGDARSRLDAAGPAKIERRPGTWDGFDTNRPAEALDRLLHDGQPHPAPLDLVAGPEGLEEAEDALVVLGRDARPVVRD